jgi:DNA-binding transcriptional MerR regulator
MDPRIPDKHGFRIGEVAALAGVEPHVVRFWESEFPELRPATSRSGQRVYARRDVERVLRLRDLLYEEGYTLEGARKALKRKATPAPVPTRTRALLDEVRKEVQALLRLTEE